LREGAAAVAAQDRSLELDPSGVPLRAGWHGGPIHPHKLAIFKRASGQSRRGSPRRFLAVLSSDSRVAVHQWQWPLELARAIVSKDNPLTARVYVIASGCNILVRDSSTRLEILVSAPKTVASRIARLSGGRPS